MSEQKKAQITKIGTVNEEGYAIGWGFDCLGDIPGINITDDGILYAGYSIEELRAIAAADQVIH
jgi:hypothetical protein